MNIIEATGSELKKEDLNQERMYYVKQFIKENNAVGITNAINDIHIRINVKMNIIRLFFVIFIHV